MTNHPSLNTSQSRPPAGHPLPGRCGVSETPMSPKVEAPRFVVRELGPRAFCVHDNITQLDYDLRFTRPAAQAAADGRNGVEAGESRG